MEKSRSDLNVETELALHSSIAVLDFWDYMEVAGMPI